MESGHIYDTIARLPCVNISIPVAGGVLLFSHHPLLFFFFQHLCSCATYNPQLKPYY